MYKVIKESGGWNVYWVEEGKERVLIPHTDRLGKIIPYSFPQAAYRRRGQLEEDSKKAANLAALGE